MKILSQMPAPTNRVFCPCFGAAEASNNKQRDNSSPEPGSNKRSSGEREPCLWLLNGSHSKENEGFYSLDNLHHLKLDNAATHPHFMPLVNSARRQGQLDFTTASTTSMHFATITLPRL